MVRHDLNPKQKMAACYDRVEQLRDKAISEINIPMPTPPTPPQDRP